jgi:hypothetical protein
MLALAELAGRDAHPLLEDLDEIVARPEAASLADEGCRGAALHEHALGLLHPLCEQKVREGHAGAAGELAGEGGGREAELPGCLGQAPVLV